MAQRPARARRVGLKLLTRILWVWVRIQVPAQAQAQAQAPVQAPAAAPPCLADAQRLSPTSAAVVELSDEMVGIGGGEIARDEMLAARRAGKPVRFFPANMNHALAVAQAARQGRPAPADFRGAAQAALQAP